MLQRRPSGTVRCCRSRPSRPGSGRPCRGVGDGEVAQRSHEEFFGLRESFLDRVDGVGRVRGWGHMNGELKLGLLVPASRDAACSACGGLELGKVRLSCVVRSGRLGRERHLARLRQLAAFTLAVRRQQQPFVAQGAKHRRLRYAVGVMMHQRTDLAAAPRRMRTRVLHDQRAGCVMGVLGPRTFTGWVLPGYGVPTPPGPLGHVEDLTRPRGRHARPCANPLEVREGPRRPSADFFRTRILTTASPWARVRSTISASKSSPTADSPPSPTPTPRTWMPAHSNSLPDEGNRYTASQDLTPIDCSGIGSWRAASAADNFSARTASTILVFFLRLNLR